MGDGKGNEKCYIVASSAPRAVVAVRDQSQACIQNKYATLVEKGVIPALPEMKTWQGDATARPDLVDMNCSAFTSNNWLVTIRQPVNPTAASSVTYIDMQTGFVWAGYVGPDGSVVDVEYIR